MPFPQIDGHDFRYDPDGDASNPNDQFRITVYIRQGVSDPSNELPTVSGIILQWREASTEQDPDTAAWQDMRLWTTTVNDVSGGRVRVGNALGHTLDVGTLQDNWWYEARVFAVDPLVSNQDTTYVVGISPPATYFVQCIDCGQ